MKHLLLSAFGLSFLGFFAGCDGGRTDGATVPDRKGHSWIMDRNPGNAGPSHRSGTTVAPPGPNEQVIIMKDGESLQMIADMYGIPLSKKEGELGPDIIWRNDLTNNPRPGPGISLIVPKRAPIKTK